MRKIYCFLFVFVTFSICLNAQLKYDTVSVNFIAPGIKHLKVEAASRPLKMDVLEIDLKNKYNSIKMAISNDKAPDLARESITSFSKRFTTDTQTVIGAINADFFSYDYGIPCGYEAIDGEFVKTSGSPAAIGFDKNGKPFMNWLTLSTELRAKGKNAKIEGINVCNYLYSSWYNLLGKDRIIMYNQYFNYSMRNETPDLEVILQPLEAWKINMGSVRCRVVSLGKGLYSQLNKSQVLLGGFGAGSDFISTNIAAGDTVEITQTATGAPLDTREFIGVYPRIVVNGKNFAVEGYNEYGKDDAINPGDRNPLSVMGFNRDSTKMFLIVCDGRRDAYSAGLNTYEMADYMLSIGIYNGGHFDSGGSSEMVLRGKIENWPSDGAERPVINAVMAISTAPKAGILTAIQTTPNRPGFYLGEQRIFKTNGVDEYYNPIPIDSSKIEYSLSDPNLGSLSSDGKFTAGSRPMEGKIYLNYMGLKDTIDIRVRGINRLSILPRSLVTDASRLVTFTARGFDDQNALRALSNDQCSWITTDPSVGKIDSLGRFIGLKEGKTKVIAEFRTNYCDAKDTAEMTVAIGKGSMMIDSCRHAENWKFSGENIDTARGTINSDGQHYKIRYSFTYDNTKIPMMHLNTNAAIPGLPDSIIVNIKTNGLNNRLWFIIQDSNGNRYKVAGKAYANSRSKYIPIPGLFSNAVSLESHPVDLRYPVSLSQIQIQLASSGKQQGAIYSDSLSIAGIRVTYPEPMGINLEDNSVPKSFQLSQNYPNPFNPSTRISFRLEKAGEAMISVYNLLGQKVAVLQDSYMNAGSHEVIWNASDFPSGVYIYRLSQNGLTLAKKMILMK